MKILMINHFPLAGSGSGVYTATIAKFLKLLGHDVKIIMPEVTTKYERLDGVEIRPIYFMKDEVIESQLPFNFPCFTTHPQSVKTFNSLTDDELNLYLSKFGDVIREEIEMFKPDVIHGQHVWVLSALASRYDIPLVVTAHGTDLIGFMDSNRFHSYSLEVVSSSDKIVTISKKNDELVRELFSGVHDKVITIENGYDTNIFYPSCESRKEVLGQFGIDGDYDKVVLFVGKLTPIKGVDMLLNSAYTYKDKNVLTVIAGDGEEKDKLLRVKEDLGLNNVYFIGNRHQSELQKLYNIADVSVVPSRKEAFGFVAVEALACGTPVIGSDQGEIPRFLNEDTGILIETGNQEQFTRALHRIIDGEVIYNREKIALYAKNNYALDNSIHKLVQVYEEAIDKSKTKQFCR